MRKVCQAGRHTVSESASQSGQGHFYTLSDGSLIVGFVDVCDPGREKGFTEEGLLAVVADRIRHRTDLDPEAVLRVQTLLDAVIEEIAKAEGRSRPARAFARTVEVWCPECRDSTEPIRPPNGSDAWDGDELPDSVRCGKCGREFPLGPVHYSGT
jgi:hypothetical protein